ncbi:hypothetical protein IF2G_03192 [Cordyceps javanica]|nr:hypothetical protein IF2G_03192 [Cordyceps javanica]
MSLRLVCLAATLDSLTEPESAAPCPVPVIPPPPLPSKLPPPASTLQPLHPLLALRDLHAGLAFLTTLPPTPLVVRSPVHPPIHSFSPGRIFCARQLFGCSVYPFASSALAVPTLDILARLLSGTLRVNPLSTTRRHRRSFSTRRLREPPSASQPLITGCWFWRTPISMTRAAVQPSPCSPQPTVIPLRGRV